MVHGIISDFDFLSAHERVQCAYRYCTCVDQHLRSAVDPVPVRWYIAHTTTATPVIASGFWAPEHAKKIQEQGELPHDSIQHTKRRSLGSEQMQRGRPPSAADPHSAPHPHMMKRPCDLKFAAANSHRLAVAPIVDPQTLVVAPSVQTRSAVDPVPARCAWRTRSSMRARHAIDTSHSGDPVSAWHAHRPIGSGNARRTSLAD
jgi:hypothetical protein